MPSSVSKRSASRRQPASLVPSTAGESRLLIFTVHATSNTLKDMGRKDMYPNVHVILTYMKDIEGMLCLCPISMFVKFGLTFMLLFVFRR